MGWEVHDQESGNNAAALLQRGVLREQCLHNPLVLHSDNGAPMKSVTLQSKMYELGITPPRGRIIVTPTQRHQGRDVEVLAKRHQLYQEARDRNPERWSGDTRN